MLFDKKEQGRPVWAEQPQEIVMATEGKPPKANEAEKGKEKLCQNEKVELSGRCVGDYGPCAPRKGWDECCLVPYWW